MFYTGAEDKAATFYIFSGYRMVHLQKLAKGPIRWLNAIGLLLLSKSNLVSCK